VMLSIDQIADRLAGIPFAQAAKQLGLFDSYERTVAIVFVMQRAPTAVDCLRVFLEWGNMCDAPWWQRSHIADMLRNALRGVRLADVLEPDALSFYNGLPEIVPIWRGCERGRERGLHWTGDRAIAEGFAVGKRCENKMPTLVRADIPKQHIFTVFISRQESEIVIDPRRLRGVKLEPLAR
jgi:hypothetical protein